MTYTAGGRAMTAEPKTTALDDLEARRQNGGAAAWGVICLIFWIVVALCWLFLSGCVAGNKAEVSAVKIESRKSTTAENINAAGKVAGGAWDRLFGNKAE